MQLVENKQILQLIRDGHSPCEVANALGLDEDAVRLISASDLECKKAMAARELRKSLEVEMIELMADLARDPDANGGARVNAAKFVVGDESADESEVGAGKLSEMFKRMKEIASKKEPRVVVGAGMGVAAKVKGEPGPRASLEEELAVANATNSN